MPADHSHAWVYKLHESYPYLKPGWQFIPDADVAQLSQDKCIVSIKENPARYLPNRDRTTFVPPP